MAVNWAVFFVIPNPNWDSLRARNQGLVRQDIPSFIPNGIAGISPSGNRTCYASRDPSGQPAGHQLLGGQTYCFLGQPWSQCAARVTRRLSALKPMSRTASLRGAGEVSL